MALTDTERDWIKELTANAVHKAAETFAAEQIKLFKCLLDKHQEGCPHGKKLERGKMLLIGVVVGIGLVAGGTGFGLAKLLAGM